jgi:hypothetical protein
MPSRNTLKDDIPDSYYHVYARGASRQVIFIDTSDYDFFLNLFLARNTPTVRSVL